jgi:hypothetical protein
LGAPDTRAAFTDLCEIGDEVNRFVTAELRYRSGSDEQRVGLGDGVVTSFDDVLTDRHDP